MKVAHLGRTMLLTFIVLFSFGYAARLLHRFILAVSFIVASSCCGTQALGRVGSAVAAPGLESAGSIAVAQSFCCSRTWGLPGLQIEPQVSCTGRWTLLPLSHLGAQDHFLINLMLRGRNEVFLYLTPYVKTFARGLYIQWLKATEQGF